MTVAKSGKKATATPSYLREELGRRPVTFDLNSDPLVMKTGKMVIKASRASGRISFYDPNGNLLNIKEHDEDGVYQTWQKGVHFATRPGSQFLWNQRLGGSG